MILKINNSEFYAFNNLVIEISINKIASSFSFSVFFKENESYFNQIFKPYSYNSVEIFDNDKKLVLTGVIVNHVFKTNGTLLLSGYSKSGILDDCSMPFALYPLESISSSIASFCAKVLPFFGIKYVFSEKVKQVMNLSNEKIKASPTESIGQFLSKICQERNVVVSHNEKGDLYFYKLSENNSPAKDISSYSFDAEVEYNGQQLFHTIQVIKDADDDDFGDSPAVYKTSIKNPLCSDTKRVKTASMTNGSSITLNNFKSIELSKTYSCTKLKISLTEWIDIKVGDLIWFQNKNLYIYEKTNFLVESIQKPEDTVRNEMLITCVLPQKYNIL